MVRRDRMTVERIILDTLACVERRLQVPFSVGEMAEFSGYSLFHFIRLFQGVTGHLPKDYLLRRRLTEAAREIQQSSRRIGDIAMDYQFNDYETFVRAFKARLGVLPGEVRRGTERFCLPLLDPLDEGDIRQRRKCRGEEPEVVERAGFILAGWEEQVNGEPKEITGLWEKFLAAEEKNNGWRTDRFYQLMYWPEEDGGEQYRLMCAAERKKTGCVPKGYMEKRIPAGRYLLFTHKGYARDVGQTYRYIYSTWLPQSRYHLSEPYNFEEYADRFYGPDREDSESLIYIPIDDRECE